MRTVGFCFLEIPNFPRFSFFAELFMTCCSNLKLNTFVFSLSSTPTRNVAGLFLLNARCTYAIVFTSLLKLLNCSHFITDFFFVSAGVMKADEGMFTSMEAKTKLTCSVYSLCVHFNQASPASHSLLSSSMMIALVPMSAGLMKPLTILHCETLVVSNISASRSATKNCCLRWEMCIHCKGEMTNILSSFARHGSTDYPS